MATRATRPENVVTHEGELTPRRRGVRGFFRYHGVWAPGVRMFRAQYFRTRAAIVSTLFLVPIVLLAATQWRSTQHALDLAASERSGLLVVRSLAPVLGAVLEVRYAHWSAPAGVDAAGERRRTLEAAERALSALARDVAASGDSAGPTAAVARLAAEWRAAARSADDAGPGNPVALAALTALVLQTMDRVIEDSRLVLDPSVESSHLIHGLSLALPAAAAGVAASWGWSSYALASGGLADADATRYRVASDDAESRLDDARKYFGHALAANPSLRAGIDLGPLDAALEFVRAARAGVEAGRGDAGVIDRHGREATRGLFTAYASGAAALDGLLEERILAARHDRVVRSATVLACLLVAGYLFYAFYLVTQGGLDEVGRRLRAMSAGDLGTAPSPLGRDEIADLLRLLHSTLVAMRTLVTRSTLATDSGGIGIFDWDVVAGTTTWDAWMYRLYGMSEGDGAGRVDQWSRRLHPDDVSTVRKAFRDAVKRGRPCRAEFRVVWPDGSVHYLRAAGQVERDASGRAVRIVGANWDITDLRLATEAAEHAYRAQADFVATVSHELRTPLQSIVGFSELGRVFAAAQPRTLQMFDDIHAGGERMLALVNGLLDLATIDGATDRLTLGTCDLGALLRQVAAELRTLADDRSVRIALPDAGPAPRADVDAFRIQQVFRNVLANAIRFAPAGSSVEIGWSDLGASGVEIGVRDRGPGVPADELETIFDAFVQSSRTGGRSGGTGLGLTICRRIMNAHGGSIVAANADGGGALFRIRLPAPGRAGVPQGIGQAAARGAPSHA